MSDKEDTTPMSSYVFEIKAQQWDRDSYYVASNYPIHRLMVVATTKEEALIETDRVLGYPADGRYWRHWIVSVKDIRLVRNETAGD